MEIEDTRKNTVSDQGPAVPGHPQPPQEAYRHERALVRGRRIVATAAACLAGFTALMLAVLFLHPLALDVPITLAIQAINFPAVDWLMVAVSAPGFVPWNFIVPGALILGLVVLRRFGEALFLGLATVATAADSLVKLLIQRPRPTDALVHVVQNLPSYSFPSGHVTEYTLVFGFCFYLAFTLMPRGPARLIVLLLTGGLIILIGPSRIWLGEHWASDVLGGYTLGFGLLLLVIWLYRRWEARHLSHPDLPTGGGPAIIGSTAQR